MIHIWLLDELAWYDKNLFALGFLQVFLCAWVQEGSSNRNPINLNCGHMITFVYG